MNKRGGKREGSGRKPKADEITMIANMDAVKAPLSVWQKLAERVEEGDTQAIKTWLAYRYGQPKQSLDHTTNGENINTEKTIIKFSN